MSAPEMTASAAAIEQVYAQHAARIRAVLVRVFGTRHLDLVDDVLQEAFRRAAASWPERGVPESPAAWILTAAKHAAIDTIRAQRTQRQFADDVSAQLQSDWTINYTIDEAFDDAHIRDDQLRMIFMCTRADVAPENRIPLMLRAVCGFSIAAIARALLLPEATVKKRLLRTRERLHGHAFELPAADQRVAAMDTVHTVLYLLFNEGFHSSDDTRPIQLELCHEAAHLTRLLVSDARVVNQDTLGLLALMQLHLARSDARLDDHGTQIALDRQDRSRWNQALIADTRELLQVLPSVTPGASGRFAIEAQIAALHCGAAGFDQTPWPQIVTLYDALLEVTGSPMARLNRAVARAYAGHMQAAIDDAQHAQQEPQLRDSHVPAAVLAHLAALRGDAEQARAHAAESSRLGGTRHEQQAMHDQIERLLAR